MKVLLFIVGVFFLIACSDPDHKAETTLSKEVEDSLRNEIRATKTRIDSLNTESVKLRKTLDSLDIPSNS